MKRVLLFLVVLSVFILIIPASAEMQMTNTGLRVVDDSGHHVRYAWKCTVYSTEERSRSASIWVVLKGSQGFEIEKDLAFVTVRNGQNDFTGTGMCQGHIWDQVKEYRISIR